MTSTSAVSRVSKEDANTGSQVLEGSLNFQRFAGVEGVLGNNGCDLGLSDSEDLEEDLDWDETNDNSLPFLDAGEIDIILDGEG